MLSIFFYIQNAEIVIVLNCSEARAVALVSDAEQWN